MCIYEEKLDDNILEKLQDFEFAVSHKFIYHSVLLFDL